MPPAPARHGDGDAQSAPERGPYTVTLEMSTEPAFQRPFYVSVSQADVASFTTDSLLPEHGTIFLRARLIDRFGDVAAEARQQHPVLGWVTLIDPAQQSLVVLPTKKPRFVWSSPPTTLTAGLWEYELSVINKATGARDFVSPLINDTSYVFADSLESNASYRWQVRAHATGGKGSGEVTVTSAGTVVIGGRSDLHAALSELSKSISPRRRSPASGSISPDRLASSSTIYDLRLREVRNIIPGALGDGNLPVGVYGRANIDKQTGCDPSVAVGWQGRQRPVRAAGRVHRRVSRERIEQHEKDPLQRPVMRFTTLGTGTISLSPGRSCAGYFLEATRPASADRLRERRHAPARRAGPGVADDHPCRAHPLSHRPPRRPSDAHFRLEVRVSALAKRAGRGHWAGGHCGAARATGRRVRRMGHGARVPADRSRNHGDRRRRAAGRGAAPVPSGSAHPRERGIFHGARCPSNRLHRRHRTVGRAGRVGARVRSARVRMFASRQRWAFRST